VIAFSEAINPVTVQPTSGRDQSNSYYNIAGHVEERQAERQATFTPASRIRPARRFRYGRRTWCGLAGTPTAAYCVTTSLRRQCVTDTTAPCSIGDARQRGDGIGTNGQVVIHVFEVGESSTLTACCTTCITATGAGVNGSRIPTTRSTRAFRRTQHGDAINFDLPCGKCRGGGGTHG